MKVIRGSKLLKLFGFRAIRMFENQSFQLVKCVEEIYTTTTICICRLEKPDIVPVEKGLPHGNCRGLSFAFTICLVHLNASVQES